MRAAVLPDQNEEGGADSDLNFPVSPLASNHEPAGRALFAFHLHFRFFNPSSNQFTAEPEMVERGNERVNQIEENLENMRPFVPASYA